MVADGWVRREDKEGNDAADIAADFGRLRQPEVVMDARRNLLRVKKEWYPRMQVLHRFMVAISWEALNHDDGRGLWLILQFGIMVPDLKFAWCTQGYLRTSPACLFLPGFLDESWVLIDSGPVWPYSVSILVEFFLPSVGRKV